MRTTTAAFDTAKDKTGAAPVWLLQIDSGSTYYYSDRAVTVDAQAYGARVVEWGDIKAVNKRMTGGGVINALSLTVTEIPTSISSQIAIANEVRVYAWFDGESLTDTLLMFKGTITDPIEVTETAITFKVAGYEESKNAVVGELITATEFSGAHEYSLGKVKPIIYGQAYAHECLPVDAGSTTTLTVDIDDTSTAAIDVTDTASFPSSGDVWIESEKVTYTGKTATTFTGITRGAGSTTQTAHSRGAYAVEDQTNYDYLIAGHSIQTPDAVYINGVALTTGWSKVESGGNSLLRITDGEALRDALRAIVADDLSVTSSLLVGTALDQEAAQGLENIVTWTSAESRYIENYVNDNVTFSTLSGCTFSEVDLSIDIKNLAKLEVKVYTNGSATPTTIHTPLDAYDGSGGGYTMSTKTYTLTVSENAAITKIGVHCSIDIRAGVVSAMVGFETFGSIVRLATITETASSAKDKYAYTLGTFTSETLQGARVSCDTVGYNYSRPDEIVEHLLLNYGNSVVAGDLDTSITGWTLSGTPTIATDTGQSGSGKSLKLTGAAGEYIERDIVLGADSLDSDHTVYVKTESGVIGEIRITDGTETNIYQFSGTSWFQLSEIGPAMTGTIELRIKIFAGTGSIWVDDLVFDNGLFSTSFEGEYASNYPLGFALTKQYDLSTLCRQIAYQCAARFFWDSGKAFLTKIPEGTPTADKALVADDVVYGSMSMRWTPTRDIINSLDARYDLRGREYLAVDSASDSTSITAYGTQDGSSKFKLDLVNSATTAGNVVDDYILKLKEPKRVAIFTTPLQNIELQRGDIVSITHPIDGGWTAKLFEILETSVTIGNVTTPDQITFTVEEI